MKRLARVLAGLAAATPAFAAAGTESQGNPILIYLFLGFGAMIIVFQAVPGLILFATMMKELFFVAREKMTGTKAKG